MDLVKKCKRVLRSNKRLCLEESGCGSYDKLSENKCYEKQKDLNCKRPPNGCVCVYVGSERQRFIIKIKIFNHPLFKTLLEDVENEYGYRNDGPLWLPCNVDLFYEALVEIETDDDMSFVGCKFPTVHKHSPCRSSNLSCDTNYEVLV